MSRRIGIDFGRTIGEISEEPAPFAFALIRHLVNTFDAENVFVISKAGPSMEEKIQKWLLGHNFYQATCFLHENVIFVRGYDEKATLVTKLGISVFFDDHIKVVSVLAPLPRVERLFWMHAEPKDILRIPKLYRHKIVPTKAFSKTMKYFQKIQRK